MCDIKGNPSNNKNNFLNKQERDNKMSLKLELHSTKMKYQIGHGKSERHFLIINNNHNKNNKINTENRLKRNLYNYNQFVKIGLESLREKNFTKQ